MARARRISLLPLLVAVALYAGCGSSSGSPSSTAATGSSAATSSTAATNSSPATNSTPSTVATSSTPSTTQAHSNSTPTSSTGTRASSIPPTRAGAIASCKHGVQSLPHLPPSARERLEAICERGVNGDVNAKRNAAEEACRELVKASLLPAGAARNRALAACNKAGRAAGGGK